MVTCSFTFEKRRNKSKQKTHNKNIYTNENTVVDHMNQKFAQHVSYVDHTYYCLNWSLLTLGTRYLHFSLQRPWLLRTLYISLLGTFTELLPKKSTRYLVLENQKSCVEKCLCIYLILYPTDSKNCFPFNYLINSHRTGKLCTWGSYGNRT